MPDSSNLDSAIESLISGATSQSRGRCATAIRSALEAAGFNVTQRPGSAKDYGPFLRSLGFVKLYVIANQPYIPKRGDIVVIQSPSAAQPHGHVAMFTGTDWVSDFVQRDIWSGPAYRNSKPPYAIYRHPGFVVATLLSRTGASIPTLAC
jgi:type VI secretion system secreted protein VgrG